jgi:4a-hydroxytetrahydrobiopterin dehydratase
LSELAKEHPQEYPKGTPSMPDDEAAALAREVDGWEIVDGKLTRTLTFKDFVQAFSFMTRVALLAETESHHPDLFNSWNQVEVAFWTHTAKGLTRNDFIMAAKVNTVI